MLSAHKYPIILADDDNEDCALFSEALMELNAGCDFHVVHDGESLMKTLSCVTLPATLFLDINMPGRNGLLYLSEIRQDPRFGTLGIIILSGAVNNHIPDHVARDSYTFFKKPNNFPDLKSLLIQALSPKDMGNTSAGS